MTVVEACCSRSDGVIRSSNMARLASPVNGSVNASWLRISCCCRTWSSSVSRSRNASSCSRTRAGEPMIAR